MARNPSGRIVIVDQQDVVSSQHKSPAAVFSLDHVSDRALQFRNHFMRVDDHLFAVSRSDLT